MAAPLLRAPRKAFTLIELLIAVVVIGILAAIAVTSFRNTKGKAYSASVRSDLQNLVTAEESFFYDHRAYTSDLDSLKATKSPGVMLSVVEATATGWSATAYHPSSWPRTCAVYFGNAAALAPASAPDRVSCD